MNPYASPRAATTHANDYRWAPLEAVPSGEETTVEESGKPPREWRVVMTPDEAWFVASGASGAVVMTHAELAQKCSLMLATNAPALVAPRLGAKGRAAVFRLRGPSLDRFRAWLLSKRDEHIAASLRKRTRFALPLGVLMVALTVVGERFDPFMMIFGAGLLVLAFVGPRFPSPKMFVFDALLWVSFAASHALSAYNGSGLSAFFVFFCLFVAYGLYRAYIFWRL